MIRGPSDVRSRSSRYGSAGCSGHCVVENPVCRSGGGVGPAAHRRQTVACFIYSDAAVPCLPDNDCFTTTALANRSRQRRSPLPDFFRTH